MPNDKEEILRASVTGIFCGYGYERYRPARFESYEVYRKNKDYIDGDTIITLTDAGGKLLAIRPDVTLSIINDLPQDGKPRKYFYDESVFRRDSCGEYHDLRQIGAEYVGGIDLYPECEIAMLAVKTLGFLGEDYVLAVGNMDVAEAFIKPLNLVEEDLQKALVYIRQKAFHELKKLLKAAGTNEENIDKLIAIVSVEGEPKFALKVVEAVANGNEEAERAVNELRVLTDALDRCGYGDKIKLDFSLIDNFRYYNGAVFRGYVRGAAQAVIRGGRYDNMLKRMGKTGKAVGFALDFDVASQLKGEAEIETVTVKRSGLSVAETLMVAEKVVSDGKRVKVCENNDEGERL